VPCPSGVRCERAGTLNGPRPGTSNTSQRKLALGCPVPCGLFARGGCSHHDADLPFANNARTEPLPPARKRHTAADRSRETYLCGRRWCSSTQTNRISPSNKLRTENHQLKTGVLKIPGIRAWQCPDCIVSLGLDRQSRPEDNLCLDWPHRSPPNGRPPSGPLYPGIDAFEFQNAIPVSLGSTHWPHHGDCELKKDYICESRNFPSDRERLWRSFDPGNRGCHQRLFPLGQW
jgi:hypothetical protein